MSSAMKRLFKGGTGSDTGSLVELDEAQGSSKGQKLVATEYAVSQDDSKKDWYLAGARYFKLGFKNSGEIKEGDIRILKVPEDLPSGPDGKALDPSIVICIGKCQQEPPLFTERAYRAENRCTLKLELVRLRPQTVPSSFPVFLESNWISTITKLHIGKDLTVQQWNESWRQVFKKMKCLTRLTLDLVADLPEAKDVARVRSSSSGSGLKDFGHRIEKISVIYENYRSSPSTTESVLDDDFLGCCASLVEKSQLEWTEKTKERVEAVKPELCFECRGGTSVGVDGNLRALDGFRLEHRGNKSKIQLVDYMGTIDKDLPLQIGYPVYGEINAILAAVKPTKVSIPSTEFLALMAAEATSNLQQLEVDTTVPVESSNALVVVSNLSKNPAFSKLTDLRIKHRGREKAPPLRKMEFKSGSYNSLECVTSLRLIRSIDDVDSDGRIAKDPLSKSELGHSKAMWDLVLQYFVNVKKFTTNGPRRSCIRQAKTLYKARPDGSPPTMEDLTMYCFIDEYHRFWAGTRTDWQFKKLVQPNRELVEGFSLTNLTVYFNKYWDQRKALKRARAMVRDCGNAGTVRLVKIYSGQFTESELLEGLENPDWLKIVIKPDYSSMRSDAFKNVTLGCA